MNRKPIAASIIHIALLSISTTEYVCRKVVIIPFRLVWLFLLEVDCALGAVEGARLAVYACGGIRNYGFVCLNLKNTCGADRNARAAANAAFPVNLRCHEIFLSGKILNVLGGRLI